MSFMKVLQFIDTFYPTIDGVTIVVENYAKILSAMGNECSVVAPRRKGYIDDRSYPVYRSRAFKVAGRCYDCALPFHDANLKNQLMAAEADIIHAHTPFNMGGYAVRIGKLKNIPVIGHFHTQYRQDFKKELKFDFAADMMLRRIMRFYQESYRVWTLTDNAVKVMRSYGYDGAVEVMLNGCDYYYPDDPMDKIALANDKYRLQGCENVLLFVGQLIEQKNIFMIVRTAKLLAERGLKFKLLFVGTGADGDRLKNLIHSLGLSDIISLIGRIQCREELSGLYLRSDLFIFPSMYDTSSLVKIEAAAHKLPAVMCKNAVSAHAIVSGENGYLCENSPESLADTIYGALQDKAELVEVGEQAYETLYLSWEQVVSRAAKRYEEIIEEYHSEHRVHKKE